MAKDVKISKFLSYVLRHKPEAIELSLDSNGWADVSELKSKSTVPFSREDLERVVKENSKKRFVLSADGLRIRASQGHSIKVDLELKPQKPPVKLYHGTAIRFWPAIQNGGLKKMNRHHVHLSSDVETASQVGTRHGKLLMLVVNAGKMFEDGHVFYKSQNGVWLTDSVPIKYLERSN